MKLMNSSHYRSVHESSIGYNPAIINNRITSRGHLMDKKANNFIDKLHMLIEKFKEHDEHATVSMLDVFLTVARSNGRINNTDLVKRTRLKKAHLSTITSQLSIYGRGGKAGMGLLDLVDDPVDRRYKLVVLTTKGNQLSKDIEDILL